MGEESFALRFRLALKALTLSRAAVASAIGVDKSLVGRWASGAVRPTNHNLSRLTAFLASRLAGFSLADWDRSLADFSALLGIDHSAALLAESASDPIALLPSEFLDAARRMILQRGAAYEGFWKTTRPSVIMDGTFFQDHGMMRIEANGLISVRMGSSGLKFEGWALPAEGNLFVILYGSAGATPLFLIFRGVPLPRAEVLEGLLLMSALNAERSPAAVPIVLERVGDLTGERSHDDVLCEEMFALESTVLESEVPDAVVNCLLRDIGPIAALSGGERFLLATAATGLTRGASLSGKLRG
jgi:transcriptional regulator with XRE-family HTH domain